MNELLLSGFAAAAFLGAVRASGWLCALASERLPERASSAAPRAVLGLLPVAFGAAALLSVLSPQLLFGGCHCVLHPHHPHLCLDHGTFSWALVAMSALGVASAWSAARSLARIAAEHLRLIRWYEQAGPRRDPDSDGPTQIELVDGGPIAACVGLLRPRIFVSAELWPALPRDERAAIVAHERAHVARRDTLTLLALQIAASLVGPPGARLVRAWRRSAELAADAAAAADVGDPCVVASALVTCGKLYRPAPSDLLSIGATHDALELRVLHLLEQPNAVRAHRRGDFVPALLAMTLVAAGLAALAGRTAHHAVETALGLVS